MTAASNSFLLSPGFICGGSPPHGPKKNGEPLDSIFALPAQGMDIDGTALPPLPFE
jgi:hypothetical protein